MVLGPKLYTTALLLLTFLPALLLAVAGCIITAAENRNAFPNTDILIYAIIAKLWNYGVIPYRDIADHKPPMVYLFLRVCFLVGGYQPLAMWRGFNILTTLGGVALIMGFRSARLPSIGIATALAYVFFFWRNPLRFAEPALLNTEHLATLFLALSYASIVVFCSSGRFRWGILSGSLFSLAVCSKQPAGIFIIPLAAHLVFYPWDNGRFRPTALMRRLGAVALGALIPVAVMVGYFACYGALRDLWQWTYTANLVYAPITRTTLPMLQSLWSENMGKLIGHMSGDLALSYRFGLLAVPILLLVRRSWLDVVGVAWLLAGTGSILFNLQTGHSHYFWFVQMPLSIALGIGLHGVAQLTSRLTNRIFSIPCFETLLSILLLLVVFYSDCQWLYQRSHRFLTSPREGLQSGSVGEVVSVAQKINPFDREPAYLMFFGPDPSIFFYGNFKPASKFIYPMSSAMGNGFKDEVASSAERVNAPYGYVTYLLNPTSLPKEGEGFPANLGKLLSQNYTFWFQGAAGYIYRRNDISPP